MAERDFAERTDRRAIGYCPVCARPFKWHQNDLDFSTTRGVVPMWKCRNGHANPINLKECSSCQLKPHETACLFMDGSRPGYGWGMATRKPAREYITGARIENERCGYQNPNHPGYPCLKKRGHDEESELGVGHDHGLVPYDPTRERFLGYERDGKIFKRAGKIIEKVES